MLPIRILIDGINRPETILAIVPKEIRIMSILSQ